MSIHPQLANLTVSPDGSRAITIGANADMGRTLLRSFDLTTAEARQLAEREAEGVLAQPWATAEGARYLKKTGSGWAAPTESRCLDWNDLEENDETHTIEGDFFPTALAKGGDRLAVTIYKGGKLGLLDARDLSRKQLVQLPSLSSTCGLCFSSDNARGALITVNQGGGTITHFDAVSGEMQSFSPRQVDDDYLIAGGLLFHGNDLIATISAAASELRVARFSLDGSVKWEQTINDECEASQMEFYHNAVWNNYHRAALVGGELVVGSNEKLFRIDANTGSKLGEISDSEALFIHQVFAVPGKNQVATLDIYGNFRLFDW